MVKKNYSHVYQLQHELQRIKQQPNQIVSETFVVLQEKTELRLYRPPTTDPDEILKREEQDEIFRFLACLNSSYESVRSQILLIPDLPYLDDVVGRVEGEEMRHTVMNSQQVDESESKALSAFNRNYNPRSEIGRAQTLIRCDYCKKEGHRREECWCLHPNLRPKGVKNGG
jgi:hypothetical protein